MINISEGHGDSFSHSVIFWTKDLPAMVITRTVALMTISHYADTVSTALDDPSHHSTQAHSELFPFSMDTAMLAASPKVTGQQCRCRDLHRTPTSAGS